MKVETYWLRPPGLVDDELPGKLIVLEGTDGVGRSTQTRLLKNWLESSGLAVFDTGLTRSQLAGRDLNEAKQGHIMGPRTAFLYYAADFADRLENEMIPALKAGYVVLTDRYIFSLIARARVRGADQEWLDKLYGFALKPDLILYLKASPEELLSRCLASGGFDYWESGMDYLHADNMYDAFVRHQASLLQEFDRMTDAYGFHVVDANRNIREVFNDLRDQIAQSVSDMLPSEHHFTDFVGHIQPVSDEPPPSEKSDLAEMLRNMLSALEDS
jgi:dTMP kinase